MAHGSEDADGRQFGDAGAENRMEDVAGVDGVGVGGIGGETVGQTPRHVRPGPGVTHGNVITTPFQLQESKQV